ncbi:MAG: creatininase family protein [Peptococcaceae bacterium]|nr:creatininase family protein [Peptococcaceae bacterium]
MDCFSTWDQAKGAQFAFLPIGSVEQHGHHLPLLTDGLIASAIVDSLAERLAQSAYKGLKLPLLPFSCSFEHAGFPGFVSLRVSTLFSVVRDIMESLEMWGVTRCVLVSGHMGNHLLRNVVQELNAPGPRMLLLPSARHWQMAYEAAGLATDTSSDMHAGEGETSILLHLLPQHVRAERVCNVDAPSRPLLEVLGMRRYTDTGAIGFPLFASADKGRALLDALVDVLIPVVEEFFCYRG